MMNFSHFEVASNIIYDEDPILTYSFTMPNGSPTPNWLKIQDPHQSASGNFEFSGTYPHIGNTEIDIRIHAVDQDGQHGFVDIFINVHGKFCGLSCSWLSQRLKILLWR